MTEQDTGVEQPATSSPPQIPIDKIESLLKAKDDTSRFVGLALVKSVLENGEVTSNAEVLNSIWQSISSKFLDRLLRSQTSDKDDQDEAKDMVDLAVAVLHAFTTLLPDQGLRESRLTKRIVPLMNSLSKRYVLYIYYINKKLSYYSASETTLLILETLTSLVSRPEGAQEFINIETKVPIIMLAKRQTLVLKVFSHAWISASTDPEYGAKVQKDVDDIVPKLLNEFKETDGVTLIGALGDILPSLGPEVSGLHVPTNP
jgi:hypothetical protein